MFRSNRSWRDSRRIGLLAGFGILLVLTGPALLNAAPMLPIHGGLGIWYAADAISGLSNQGSVALWSDLSGNGRDAAQAGSAQRPSYVENVLNGRPVVRFDGTNHFLETAAFAPAIVQADNIFIVFQADVTTEKRVFDRYDPVHPSPGLDRQSLFLNNGGSHAFAGAGPVNANFTDTTWNLHEVLFDGPNSYWRLNGAAPLVSGDFGTHRMGQLLLGINRTKDGHQFAGDIAEFIVFERGLNGAERIILESHLSAKYNLAVPGMKYAGYGDYDRDVFGVGRVDASNEVASNGMAGFHFAAPSLSDDSWLLAGHKTPTNVWTTDDVAAGLGRWDRVWYVDGTGNVGNGDIAFDFAAGGAPELALNQDYRLLYSPTNAYSFNVLPHGGTVDGQTVTFAGVTGLEAGGYYTLGVVGLADLLKVDFGAAGQPVQSGFEPFSMASGNPAESQTYATSLGNVTVTLSTDAASGLGFRTWAGTATGDFAYLENLLSTEAKSSDTAGGNHTLTLELDGLPAGWDYILTTYHHGTSHTTDLMDFELTLDGASVGTYSQETGWGPESISTVQLSFQSDGVNPVVLTFTVPSTEVVLNGFVLMAVPEPGSLLLLAFGAMGLLLWRRR